MTYDDQIPSNQWYTWSSCGYVTLEECSISYRDSSPKNCCLNNGKSPKSVQCCVYGVSILNWITHPTTKVIHHVLACMETQTLGVSALFLPGVLKFVASDRWWCMLHEWMNSHVDVMCHATNRRDSNPHNWHTVGAPCARVCNCICESVSRQRPFASPSASFRFRNFNFTN